MPARGRRIVLALIATALVAVAAFALLVRMLEAQFAFFPAAGETETPQAFGIPYDSTTLATADGEHLHAWTLPRRDAAALVVYFHGNGGNLSVWSPILAGVHAHGYAVRTFDYRGYGLSTGRPSERGLYRDVDAAIAWALKDVEPDVPVVYWGRSLGTTMAAYAATRRRPDRLILESGFPDVRTAVGGTPLAALTRFSSYRFPTADYARQAHCPVLVMHGDADSVIPYAAGTALFDAVAEPKQWLRIRGGDHNDTVPADAAAYWAAVRDFIALRTQK